MNNTMKKQVRKSRGARIGWSGIMTLTIVAAYGCTYTTAPEEDDEEPTGDTTGPTVGSGGGTGGGVISGAGGSSCTPDCSGLSCGADPICGTSCGTCSAGTCSGGACVVECAQEGQTSCNGLEEVATCSGGQWQTSACPSLEVCAQGGCRPVCDGWLQSANGPSACFFPVVENGVSSLVAYTTDPAKLAGPDTLGGAVWDANQVDAPITPASDTSWPWQWDFAGDEALAAFRLTQLTPPLSKATFRYRARVAGNGAVAYQVNAFNDAGTMGSTSTLGSSSWQTYETTVDAPLVSEFHPTEINGFSMKAAAGLGCTPGPCAVPPSELSWFMIELAE